MGKKYTKIPADTFKKIQMNAGVFLKNFNPATGEFNMSDILGATTGGNNFKAEPSYTDFGEDIDNCPKNTMELKRLDDWAASATGTFVTVSAALARRLVGAADIDGLDSTHIIPRRDLKSSDFSDVWWVGDYSDENTGANAGYLAIHMMNALNTAGFEIKSTDKEKGQFAYEYTAHYSISDQDTVPFEIYIKEGSSTDIPYVLLDKHAISLTVNDTYTFTVDKYPADAVVSWNTGSGSVATVSDGTVTAAGTGNTIITATITVDGVSYNDTCTVVVAEGA